MNKLIICFLVFNSIAFQALSQDNKEVDYYLTLDKVVKDTTGYLRLNHVLRQEFSRIIKTNTNGTIGNYVGLSTKDNNLSFAYSLVRKENVLQIKGGGGVTDGITNIFSNSELNSGTNIGFNFYRMFGHKHISIVFDEVKSLQKKDHELTHAFELYKLTDHKKKVNDELDKKKAEIQKLEALSKRLQTVRSQLLAGGRKTYIDSIVYVDLNYKRSLIEIELTTLESNINTIKTQVNQTVRQLQQVRDNNPNRNAARQQFAIDSLLTLKPLYIMKQSLKVTKDSLKTINKQIRANTFDEYQIIDTERKLKIAKYEFTVAEEKLEYHQSAWDFGDVNYTYEENKIKNLDKFKNIRAKEVALTWFGGGFGLENNSFKLLDSLNAVKSERDLIPTINLSLTRYVNKLISGSAKRRNISYSTIAAKISFGNNLGTLKELTIESTDSLTSNTASVSSQKAFSGFFNDEVISGQLSLDHYRFVGGKDTFGIHLRTQIDIIDKKTVTSLRAGVLFAALSQDDYTSVINFELFIGLNDIFKEGEEDSLFNRNVIGIQTTIPFNLKLK
ncbi:AAA family ATPase [Roseivirga echinicomitans]|uniref:Uncharacterized protein n=1 Tax=Roseivirga echinicomitans TaxID=296218 RepID=A0A150X241_9BACT|nr:hypothetical protein [Roseivirga echinicomitans]KYG72788.1 hypothetical protein AWN68_08785 [Roseivirga echinicomitans]